MWKENYQTWKEASLPVNLKKELKKMNDKELEDAFSQDLEFGTGGLRGVMGVGTNRMNEIVVKKITKGFGNYLINNNLKNGVAISHDNRNNSKEFAFTTAKVLAAMNIKVYIYPELRPTPMLSYAVRHFNTSGGIMITASHNPKEYNGYKVYNKEGGQLNLEESNLVIDEVSKVKDIFNINETNNDLIKWINVEEIDTLYLDKVKSITINPTTNNINLLYSPLHGTGGPIVSKLFKDNNINFYPYMPHMINDGNFPNTKSSNPEEHIAYEDIIKYAKTIKADIIALTDPDADRLGVAVLHNNEYEILNGNQLAIVTLYYLVSQKKQKNIDMNNGYVFMSNVTTDLIKKITDDFNLNLVETLSGFKFIADAITKMPKDSKYIFGCEESNGNIISDFVRDKDAIQAVFMFTEIASYLKTNNQTIIDYLNEIYNRYGFYLEKTVSYTFKGLEGKTKMSNLMAEFRNKPVDLPGTKIVSSEDTLIGEIKNYQLNKTTKSLLPKSNVIKYIYEDGSWVIARPSGTEPKLKIYFSVNESSLDLAKEKLQTNIDLVNNLINN
ncbi:MAG: phospho-sugar mutase [Acholeplasma sp.]|nr:phospho-sugar mutase [Acholeplasma sp.]